MSGEADEYSLQMRCPHCGARISTLVKHRPTIITHLMALLMCALGCWCCCCLPYCINSCMVADHYCPRCEAYIGSTY